MSGSGSDSSLKDDAIIMPKSSAMTDLLVRPFFDKWSLYFHLSNDNNWTISAYKLIMSGIDNPITLLELKRQINESIITKAMLFMMRNHIGPMWEDPLNNQGGYFSFKIASTVVHSVWWDFVFLMCGETLTKNPKHMQHIHGLTISPKYEHSIIKIWLKDMTLQDYEILNLAAIRDLDSQKPLFKKHGGDK